MEELEVFPSPKEPLLVKELKNLLSLPNTLATLSLSLFKIGTSYLSTINLSLLSFVPTNGSNLFFKLLSFQN
jgi:hypothetical protein